ncbi:hypothetical protein D910_02733 [Dendroctonus ponderosae]
MNSESICEEYSLTWKGHVQHVRDSFSKLWQNSAFCDVTLYAEGQKIGAHKAFLTACSGYFSKLFEEFKEEKLVIVLKGVQFNVLQHILRFIYNGEVSIEVEKLGAFLETAEFLNIFGLIKDKIQRRKTSSVVFETDQASNTVAEGADESETGECDSSEEISQCKNKLKAPKMFRIDTMSLQENTSRESNQRTMFLAGAARNEWIGDIETSGSLHQLRTEDAKSKKRKIKPEKRSSSLAEIKEVERTLVNYQATLTSLSEDGFSNIRRSPVRNQSKRDNICLICGVTFARRNLLRQHLQLHEKIT